jgi:hypothetical protein
VYGRVADALKRQLPLEFALASTAALVALLYVAVVVKNRVMHERELRGPWRILEPILK